MELSDARLDVWEVQTPKLPEQTGSGHVPSMIGTGWRLEGRKRRNSLFLDPARIFAAAASPDIPLSPMIFSTPYIKPGTCPQVMWTPTLQGTLMVPAFATWCSSKKSQHQRVMWYPNPWIPGLRTKHLLVLLHWVLVALSLPFCSLNPRDCFLQLWISEPLEHALFVLPPFWRMCITSSLY